jgi:hypothetical protein
LSFIKGVVGGEIACERLSEMHLAVCVNPPSKLELYKAIEIEVAKNKEAVPIGYDE